MAPVPPFLLKTGDNPEGVDQSVFDGIIKAIVEDRPAYFSAFFRDFFNVDVLLENRISHEAIQASWNVAAGASAKATLDCVPSWLIDVRDDLPRIDVPTLIIRTVTATPALFINGIRYSDRWNFAPLITAITTANNLPHT